MRNFKYPTERVSVQLRSPPGGFTSKALEDSRGALARRQLSVMDGPRCKVCGDRRTHLRHARFVTEFDHQFVPMRIQS
jgi:hypothetical protein